MEDGLRDWRRQPQADYFDIVLILVVVEDGLRGILGHAYTEISLAS